MKTVILVAALCAAAAFAQVPQACVSPQAFTANVHEFNHGDGTENRYRLTVDQSNKRVRRLEEVHAHTPGRRFYDIIELHKENIVYRYDLSSKHCEKGPIHHPWHEIGVPANATFTGSQTIGSPEYGIIVNNYEERLHHGGHWHGSFTDKDCVFVHEVDARNISSSVTFHYFDTVIFADPQDFIPPRECE